MNQPASPETSDRWEKSCLFQDWEFSNHGIFKAGYLRLFQLYHYHFLLSFLINISSGFSTNPAAAATDQSGLRNSFKNLLFKNFVREMQNHKVTSLMFTALNSQHLTSSFISYKKKINKFSWNSAVKNRHAFKKLLWVGKHMATDFSFTRIRTNSHMVAWAIMTKTRLYIL